MKENNNSSIPSFKLFTKFTEEDCFNSITLVCNTINLLLFVSKYYFIIGMNLDKLMKIKIAVNFINWPILNWLFYRPFKSSISITSTWKSVTILLFRYKLLLSPMLIKITKLDLNCFITLTMKFVCENVFKSTIIAGKILYTYCQTITLVK